MSGKNKKLIAGLLVVVLLLIVGPFLALKGAEFGGSDDAGSAMVEEIAGEYEPWFTPVLETLIDGELPGEIESLLFCVQTGIGVGILAFCMGRLVERKKWTDRENKMTV
ncbi:MAG: energy-coupling factor ABC transporter substrate-binding protein [Hungatella hathewayi]|nr:energy-coupling factor ABC transporter substrate-binding protein [Hungatella hathewayi]